MSAPLRLVIFDVDGTLVDSQADILAAFAQAFAVVGRPLPAPVDVMAIVGLSLDIAVRRLVPQISDADCAVMVEAYKDTGKSRRGLDHLIKGHGLDGLFVTQQVADFHPSKPHPSMILQAMADAGVDPAQTVMVGDTSYDMEMAAAAGVTGIGVNWGYHAPEALGAAHHVIDRFDELPAALDKIWSV